MQIQAERRDNVMIVAPVGRVDSNTSSDLEQRLLHDIGAGERRFLLDLAGVEYISSAGLRVLLMLAKRLREEGGALVLHTPGESVRLVFELAGFLPLFEFAESREAGLGRLAGSA